MTEIIPAILPKSFDEIEEKLSFVFDCAQTIQIDICDGLYTNSRTWPYLKNFPDNIFTEIIDQDKPFPYWEDFDFEFDLMTKKTYEKIPDFISAGASRIVVHKNALDEDEFKNILKDYGKKSEDIGFFDIELGVAIPNDFDIDKIAEFKDQIHFVQVMGINKIGFQGQEFNTKTIKTVEDIKNKFADLIVSVDGGVNLDTAPLLKKAGADRLIVGSAIFNTTDIIETIDLFNDIQN